MKPIEDKIGFCLIGYEGQEGPGLLMPMSKKSFHKIAEFSSEYIRNNPIALRRLAHNRIRFYDTAED